MYFWYIKVQNYILNHFVDVQQRCVKTRIVLPWTSAETSLTWLWTSDWTLNSTLFLWTWQLGDLFGQGTGNFKSWVSVRESESILCRDGLKSSSYSCHKLVFGYMGVLLLVLITIFLILPVSITWSLQCLRSHFDGGISCIRPQPEVLLNPGCQFCLCQPLHTIHLLLYNHFFVVNT